MFIWLVCCHCRCCCCCCCGYFFLCIVFIVLSSVQCVLFVDYIYIRFDWNVRFVLIVGNNVKRIYFRLAYVCSALFENTMLILRVCTQHCTHVFIREHFKKIKLLPWFSLTHKHLFSFTLLLVSLHVHSNCSESNKKRNTVKKIEWNIQLTIWLLQANEQANNH